MCTADENVLIILKKQRNNMADMMQNDEHFVYLLCARDGKMHRSELQCIDMMPKKAGVTASLCTNP